MDPANYSSQITSLSTITAREINDNRRRKVTAQEMYSPINFNNMNVLTDCKFVPGVKLNNYNEYMRILKSKDAIHKDNGNFYVNPAIPVNLLPPPSQNITNNNVLNYNNKKANWKNHLDSIVQSPHDSESEESCQSYIARKPSPENRIKHNITQLNGMQGYEYAGQNKNNTTTNVPHGYNTVQVQMNTQYQGSYNYKPRYYSNSNANTRVRRDNKRQHPQEIFRRVFGLMERFTSRSHLMRISTIPSSAIIDDEFTQLNQSIWDVFCAKAQKEETYLHKLELWKMVFLHIRKILVRYGLFMVGSTMSGLGTESSDIDMCLLVKPCLNDPRSDALGYLQNIQNVLLNCDFVTSPEVILAKVPILKFRDSRYGFEVDLNCNNAVGIRNTHLLHCYAHLDWRVRPLVIMAKVWAQANYINDAKRMTISSYSLVLMVIHFMQCGVTPPVIPCLHGLYPQKFSVNLEIHNIDIQEELAAFCSDNKQTLGELFLGFLHYYSFFDYDRYAISVREGSVLLKEECRYAKSLKNDVTQWKLLCVEEPFDLTNAARSVYDVDTFEHIKKVFRLSFKILSESRSLHSILPNVELFRR